MVEYWMEFWIRNAFPPLIPPLTRCCLTVVGHANIRVVSFVHVNLFKRCGCQFSTSSMYPCSAVNMEAGGDEGKADGDGGANVAAGCGQHKNDGWVDGGMWAGVWQSLEESNFGQSPMNFTFLLH